MAKSRLINTKFWIDDYISNLDPSEKLLFLYFLTSPYTDICGVYEVPLKHVALETGLDKEMVIKIVARFSKDKKIFYENGWVAIKNFAKHQQDNPKVKKGVEIGLSKAPKKLLDRLSIDYGELSHSNSNSNSNLNTSEPSSQFSPEIIKAFEEVNPACKKFYGNKTQRKACDNLVALYGLEQVLKVISFLPKSNSMPYMPRITTPLQLEDKWSALESAIKQKKSEKISKTTPNYIL